MEKYFISTAMTDAMTLLMIESKLIGLWLRGSVFAPLFRPKSHLLYGEDMAAVCPLN